MNLDNDTFELEIRNSEPIEATLSTDTPVQMGDSEEILLHSPENIEFHTTRLPLLLNHDSSEQIGIVEGLRIMGDKLMGKIRLASDDKAQEIYQDIKDGIRENLSIGYQVLKAHFDDMGRKIVTKYRVMEVSLVPIPADQNAGIGRSIECVQENDDFYIRTFKQENKMSEIKESRKEKNAERERCNEIISLAKHHDKMDLGMEHVESGKSVEQFRSVLLDSIESQPLDVQSRSYDLPKEYSVVNALRGIQDVSARGLEWEISQDLEKHQPKTNANAVLLDTRAMVGSSDVVQTTVDSRIQDFLQAKSIIANLPVTRFSGLTGDLKIPVGTSASGFTALQTDGTTQASQTDITFTSRDLTAHRFGDVVPLSYGLLQQATPDMESFVRRTIANTFAQGYDDQILGGSGSSGNVKGILNTTGINVVSCSGSDPAFANLLSCVTEIGADNVDLTRLARIVNPANLDNLSTAVKYSSTASPLLDMNVVEGGQVGTMLGYPVFATTKISADNYLLGDFSHLAVGEFGGIEVAMNPFFDDRRFIQSLNAIFTFDAVVIHPTAFCKMTKA